MSQKNIKSALRRDKRDYPQFSIDFNPCRFFFEAGSNSTRFNLDSGQSEFHVNFIILRKIYKMLQMSFIS